MSSQNELLPRAGGENGSWHHLQHTKADTELDAAAKNTRKRPDKTSGRKRPRLDDIDVVAADDHDSEQRAQLHAAINVVAESAADDGTEPPTTSSSSSTTVSVRPDVCHACVAAQPLGTADVTE